MKRHVGTNAWYRDERGDFINEAFIAALVATDRGGKWVVKAVLPALNKDVILAGGPWDTEEAAQDEVATWITEETGADPS